MKSLLKVVAVGTALTLGAAAIPTATYAGERCNGDNDWATVGKVLTGVAAVGILAAIIHDADHHGASRADHCAPPPCWIPGHYESRPERICIPGYWSTVTEPPQYGWVQTGCHAEYVMIRPGCTRQVWVPERYEVHEARVWVPAHAVEERYAYNR